MDNSGGTTPTVGDWTSSNEGWATSENSSPLTVPDDGAYINVSDWLLSTD
jgi:hypothetical protein